jgi:repressor LexA
LKLREEKTVSGSRFTEKQQRVVRFIQEHWKRSGCAPSYRQIAGHMNVDVRSAFQHVTALERKGVLERYDGRIELLDDYRPEQGIPVLGRVAAGTPILAEQNCQQHLNLAGMLDDDGMFILRVQGDSMMDAGILNGDLVLAREQSRVENGEIAVVLIGQDATVKRVYFGRKSLRLEPANPDYQPMVFSEPSEVRIVGKVIMAVRTF